MLFNRKNLENFQYFKMEIVYLNSAIEIVNRRAFLRGLLSNQNLNF